jgi:nitroimidazol reductase NimA-like FMN-containing flavoprotein (pyridoxamine 5'-phosphate oxidase superfamily)
VAAIDEEKGSAVIHEMTVLTTEECQTLLGGHHFGRVAFVDTVGVLPLIIPVNYVWTDDTVVFRADSGSKLRAATRGAPVAFAIDGLDQQRRLGWSVMVRGHAREITDQATRAVLDEMPLVAWSPRERPHYVRVTPRHLIGRQLSVAGLPSEWWTVNP